MGGWIVSTGIVNGQNEVVVNEKVDPLAVEFIHAFDYRAEARLDADGEPGLVVSAGALDDDGVYFDVEREPCVVPGCRVLVVVDLLGVGTVR